MAKGADDVADRAGARRFGGPARAGLALVFALTLALNALVVAALSRETAPSLHPHADDALAVDFVALWGAGALANRGEAAAAYDRARLLEAQREGLGFPYRHGMYWLYPPIAQPFLQPFALLDPPRAQALWAALGLAAFLALCLAILPHWLTPVAAAAAGPVAANLYNGQTGLFIAALFGLHLLWLGRRPGLAAAALALLAIKPHVALAAPLLQLARGRWGMLAWASCWLALLAAAVTAAYGPGIWRAFAGGFSATADYFIVEGSVEEVWRKYVNLFGVARAAGLSLWPAALAQLAVSGAAAWALARAARRPGADVWAVAALTIYAAALIAPRIYVYDLPMLVVGVLFQLRAAGGAPRPAEIAAFALAFVAAEIGFLYYPQAAALAAPALFLACLPRVFAAQGRAGVGSGFVS